MSDFERDLGSLKKRMEDELKGLEPVSGDNLETLLQKSAVALVRAGSSAALLLEIVIHQLDTEPRPSRFIRKELKKRLKTLEALLDEIDEDPQATELVGQHLLAEWAATVRKAKRPSLTLLRGTDCSEITNGI